nr:VCBS domain-containing protein [Bradyrhizobium guangxiense]
MTAKGPGHVPAGAFVVPNPDLVFHGNFKREGIDLVLSKEGAEFVLRDYFKGETRAAIASPDGAHLTGDIVSALTGQVQVAQAAPGAAAAQVIGHVTKLTGTATVIRNGVSVILNNGDNVEKGDVVSTGADSTLGITFIDGTVFGLSSNARMVLNEMVYDPNGSSNSSLLSLVAGTITFVAGETAKHGDMKIDTPVATMGIRGTAVLTQINFIVPAGGGDPQPQASFQVLVEPNGTTGSYILFDKVTLLPIATVNQAGQMIQISGGNVSVSNAQLSPEVQKLIEDVFTLKFTDNNTNTKLTTNFTDSIVPESIGPLMKTVSATVPTFSFTVASDKSVVENQSADIFFLFSPTKISVTAVHDKAHFSIAEQVKIADSNPSDVLTPYVSGSAAILSITGPNLPDGIDLAKLVSLDVTTGVVSYDPAKFKFLGANKQIVITIGFDSRAGADLFHETITVTITGTNDGASISGTAAGAVKEDGTLAASGTLAVSDVDSGENHFQTPASLSGSYGTFTFDPLTGVWTYTLNNAAANVQALVGGQIVHDKLTVTSADGTASQLIDVTITGTNDGASISGTAAGAVKEDGTLTANGTLAVSDVDSGENHFQTPASLSGSYGTFTFDPLTGVWTYTLNNAAANVQALVGGQIVHDKLTVTSADGTASQLIDVTITGTNEGASISGTAAGAVKEDGTLTANGTLAVSDVDSGENHFQTPASLSGSYGTFTFDPLTGVWTYTLNNAAANVQALVGGQIVHDKLTVTSADGTASQLIDVTITGTNDGASISGTAAGAVKEDGTLAASGTLAVSDVDSGENHFQTPASLSGSYGTFTFDPLTGVWTYTLNNAAANVQALVGGQIVHDKLTVTSADGTASQLIDVTITGTNEGPRSAARRPER